jgi:hypothetical protein
MQLRGDGLTWQTVGDEVVVLDLDGSVYLRLNDSARTLWELLADDRTQEELVDALVDQYGIDHGRASADVADFLAELRRRGLIES